MYYWLTALAVSNFFFLVISLIFILRYVRLTSSIHHLCETVVDNNEQHIIQTRILKDNDEALLELVKEAFSQIQTLNASMITSLMQDSGVEEQIAKELGFLAPEGENLKVRREDDGGDELLLGDVIPKP